MIHCVECLFKVNKYPAVHFPAISCFCFYCVVIMNCHHCIISWIIFTKSMLVCIKVVTTQLFLLEKTLFWQKTSLRKKMNNSVKTWYFDQIKSFLKLMIFFSYFCQKNSFPFRARPIMTPFLCKLSPQKSIFNTLYKLFLELSTGLQHKLLIESPNIFQSPGISMGFFFVDILHEV